MLAEMSDVHTLCLNIKSAFFTTPLELAEPPAQPPATQMIASNFSLPRISSTLL
jgi:hypothetical protein